MSANGELAALPPSIQTQYTVALGNMLFPNAASFWLQSRKHYIAPRTFEEYAFNIKVLTKYFGEMRLGAITADHIRDYQQMRLATVGPVSINHECNVLQQLLKRAGKWFSIESYYQALPMPKEQRGRVLSEDQRKRLFAVAQSNPGWEAAYFLALISVNTTAGPKETYTLRLKDIDLERRMMTVQPEGAKNAYRARPIPLNDEALYAAQLALDRAKKLGSFTPEHYVFPFRINRALYDPTRHQSHFNKTWVALRNAADLPGFRMYDLRHHAITSMLENPDVSEETVETVAGHISRKMKKRYSHVRIEALRAAVAGMQRLPQAVEQIGNQDVLEWLEAGLDAEIVVAKIKKIKRQNCGFDTSTDALKNLKAAGVPNSVILAMVKA
jgi:integrase